MRTRKAAAPALAPQSPRLTDQRLVAYGTNAKAESTLVHCSKYSWPLPAGRKLVSTKRLVAYVDSSVDGGLRVKMDARHVYGGGNRWLMTRRT